MQYNNIFILSDNEPVARYSKAVEYNISGMRLDLEGKPVDFLLATQVPGTFQYNDEVVEIYTEKEHRYFMNANRHLLEAGLVKPYGQSKDKTNLSQVLSDEDVAAIVALRIPSAIAKRIADINSIAVLNRVYSHAEEVGLSAKSMDVIKKRTAALQN